MQNLQVQRRKKWLVFCFSPSPAPVNTCSARGLVWCPLPQVGRGGMCASDGASDLRRERRAAEPHCLPSNLLKSERVLPQNSIVKER